MTARTTDETDASPAPGPNASQHPHHEQSTTRSNNASEQALKGPKRHQAVSGYWHTRATLAGYCRVRSYLVSARGHGIRAIDAIHAAPVGQPWLPVPVTT